MSMQTYIGFSMPLQAFYSFLQFLCYFAGLLMVSEKLQVSAPCLCRPSQGFCRLQANSRFLYVFSMSLQAFYRSLHASSLLQVFAPLQACYRTLRACSRSLQDFTRTYYCLCRTAPCLIRSAPGLVVVIGDTIVESQRELAFRDYGQAS